ncbi:MAG: hypothetical protein QG607_503 [Patescibacteria group bacterium]|nr:hypothetical protein [Patescibacteria group bacterium]
MSKFAKFGVAAVVLAAMFILYRAYIWPAEQRDLHASVIKESVESYKEECRLYIPHSEKAADWVIDNTDVRKGSLNERVELLRKHHPEVPPSWIGLSSFAEVEKLERICIIKDLKARVDAQYSATIDCEEGVSACVIRAEFLNEQLVLISVKRNAAQLKPNEELEVLGDIKSREMALRTRIAKAFEAVLARYPNDSDDKQNPLWIAAKTTELYKKAGTWNSDVELNIKTLMTQAYARRIDYMVRQLNAGVMPFPSSIRIEAKLREYIKDSGLKLEEFGVDDAWLIRASGRDPRVHQVRFIGPAE